MDLQAELIERIRRADRAGARQLLDAWAAEHGYDRVLAEVLEPTLLRIGEEWRSVGSFTIAQAFVAGKVAEDMLVQITAQESSEAQAGRRPVVIGNIEDDFHALGRRMVGTSLRANAWLVHDLGNDVLPATFVDKAIEVGARVIGASAMMMTTARNIRKLREEIDRRGLTGRVQLAVGGATFLISPGLVEEVGGDGTAPNALAAAGLFDQLWQRSVEKEAAS